ncbi:SOS response-associated peptidase [Salinicola sp. LHM]|uniref:SOS response-associated peptidase n=1 Tax=Salinicola sp. LHM TaxID=3065298 RepID=UPI002ACD637C|nr:SOS response-associated peptidase [Salinicola sp. LHM]WQH34348.1 SOS response-associated peptidase [Salinicola sp. LHM]
MPALHSGQLSLDALWWGYRPDGKAPQPINATVEKIATSPDFRVAFAHHRCLVPANGWYEWLTEEGRKPPHYLARQDGEPLWFASIWTDRPDGKPGCAILTEPAHGVAKAIHPRMPLNPDQQSLVPWLDTGLTDRETVSRRVHHLPHDRLTHRPVSPWVNKPVEDDPDLIEAVG